MSCMNYCLNCESGREFVRRGFRKLVSNRHDRFSSLETFSQMVCMTCGESELNSAPLCLECNDREAVCDDRCLECEVQFYSENPDEFESSYPRDGVWRIARSQIEKNISSTA